MDEIFNSKRRGLGVLIYYWMNSVYSIRDYEIFNLYKVFKNIGNKFKFKIDNGVMFCLVGKLNCFYIEWRKLIILSIRRLLKIIRL